MRRRGLTESQARPPDRLSVILIKNMTDIFSIRESIRFGWEKTRTHSGLVFKVVITLFAIQFGSSIASKVLEGTLEGVFATLLFTIVGVVVGAGFANVALKLSKSQHTDYADIIPPLGIVWEYAVATLLVVLIILGGFILLIIPAFYFALRYMFVNFAVLEGEGITGSLRASAKMTLGVKWKLLKFGIVMIGVNILGALAFMIGLLVTIPVTLIASAYVYDILKKRVEVKA